MKTPEEIKEALKICALRGYDGCNACSYNGEDDCSGKLMMDALSYIEQLEGCIAELEAKPDKPDSDLPNGWIEIRGDNGEAMFIDASKVVSVEDCYPRDCRRIVRFAETRVRSSESVEEILAKIREATT